MNIKDIKLKMFAAISLLRHECEPAKEDIMDIGQTVRQETGFITLLSKWEEVKYIRKNTGIRNPSQSQTWWNGLSILPNWAGCRMNRTDECV